MPLSWIILPRSPSRSFFVMLISNSNVSAIPKKEKLQLMSHESNATKRNNIPHIPQTPPKCATLETSKCHSEDNSNKIGIRRYSTQRAFIFLLKNLQVLGVLLWDMEQHKTLAHFQWTPMAGALNSITFHGTKV